jgi:hypothetical protein
MEHEVGEAGVEQTGKVINVYEISVGKPETTWNTQVW